MSAEKETLQRVHGALFHLRNGLAPFVESRMKRRFGGQWLLQVSRAQGGSSGTALDVYALLKTTIDNWRDVFDEAFSRNEKHRVRSFISTALEARNVVSHLSAPLIDQEALRYLDAMHELLRAVKAPATEIGEVKRLYDEQRCFGPVVPAGRVAAEVPKADGRAQSVRRARQGTIEDRLLEYVRAHPGLDDDELSAKLAIHPRQTINQAARRLEAAGKFRRERGPKGKIVNRVRGAG